MVASVNTREALRSAHPVRNQKSRNSDEWVPTRQEIERRVRQINAGWTEQERKHRANILPSIASLPLTLRCLALAYATSQQ